jgi:hypothetical protein
MVVTGHEQVLGSLEQQKRALLDPATRRQQ